MKEDEIAAKIDDTALSSGKITWEFVPAIKSTIQNFYTKKLLHRKEQYPIYLLHNRVSYVVRNLVQS